MRYTKLARFVMLFNIGFVTGLFLQAVWAAMWLATSLAFVMLITLIIMFVSPTEAEDAKWNKREQYNGGDYWL
jgi:uncharacterized membrane protein